MRWSRDKYGRFLDRPYYTKGEMECMCEKVVCEFMIKKYGKIHYPLTTNDLTILIEQKVSDLDLYVDTSKEGRTVEGYTEFYPTMAPAVRISALLSTGPLYSNRYRSTLTHELSHVLFHKCAYDRYYSSQNDLFGGHYVQVQRCHQENIISTREHDWLEWQAGFCCGALLMPWGPLTDIITHYVNGQSGYVTFPIYDQTRGANDLISDVVMKFDVSEQAARVRLAQHKFISNNEQLQGSLFGI